MQPRDKQQVYVFMAQLDFHGCHSNIYTGIAAFAG